MTQNVRSQVELWRVKDLEQVTQYFTQTRTGFILQFLHQGHFQSQSLKRYFTSLSLSFHNPLCILRSVNMSQIFFITCLFAGNTPGSGRLSAIFLVINAALGAGLLNFPQAFDQAGGIVTAIAVQGVSILLMTSYQLQVHHSFK